MKKEYRIVEEYVDIDKRRYYVEMKVTYKSLLNQFMYGFNWCKINNKEQIINEEMAFDFAFWSYDKSKVEDFINWLTSK